MTVLKEGLDIKYDHPSPVRNINREFRHIFNLFLLSCLPFARSRFVPCTADFVLTNFEGVTIPTRPIKLMCFGYCAQLIRITSSWFRTVISPINRYYIQRYIIYSKLSLRGNPRGTERNSRYRVLFEN